MGSIWTKVAAAGCALVLLGTSGCAVVNPFLAESGAPQAASARPVPAGPMSATIKAEHGNDSALPSDSLLIEAVNGEVTAVTVVAQDGRSVLGNYANGKWTGTRGLFPNTEFTAKVTLKNVADETQEFTTKFKTIKPKIDATYEFRFIDKEFGVGMPVVIWFASDVTTKEQRAAVERAILVSPTPYQEGSWGWANNRQLMWRPKEYWQPGTKVQVTANLAGLQTGPDKWIGADTTGSLSIGAAHVSKVDMAKFRLYVYENGKQIKDIPITNGIAKYPTRFGTKVILDKIPVERMKSEGTDVKDEEYDLQVNWALRTTWTGEYLHAAPWSTWAQGKTNASHGCTGMSDGNAKWFFDFSQIGDVVEYVGSTAREFKQSEGIAVWNLSWDEWQKLSAQK